jgi:hypothetical protein
LHVREGDGWRELYGTGKRGAILLKLGAILSGDQGGNPVRVFIQVIVEPIRPVLERCFPSKVADNCGQPLRRCLQTRAAHVTEMRNDGDGKQTNDEQDDG